MNQYKIMGITFLIIIVLVSVGFNIKVGIENWQTKVYQQGVQAGARQINKAVVSQFLSTGKLTLTLPVNESGQYDPQGSQSVQIVLMQAK